MVRLNDDYCVSTDETCYMLLKDLHSETIDKKDGVAKHNYKTLGYYSNLENALQGARDILARKKLGEKELSLSQAIDELKDINKMFQEIKKI